MSKSDSFKLMGKSKLVTSYHDILLPGAKLIKVLEKMNLPILRIIPQQIGCSPKGRGGLRINISRTTKNGIKVNTCHGNAKQSLMVLCHPEDIDSLLDSVEDAISKLLV